MVRNGNVLELSAVSMVNEHAPVQWDHGRCPSRELVAALLLQVIPLLLQVIPLR